MSSNESLEALLERARAAVREQPLTEGEMLEHVASLTATLRAEREHAALPLDGTTPLHDALRALEADHRELQRQLHLAERENRALLASRVIATRLSGLLDRPEVLDAIQELVINLLGSEEVAIYEPGPGGLCVTRWSGAGTAPLTRIGRDDGAHGEAVAAGTVWVREEGASDEAAQPSACVPLQLGALTVGAIAIFRLLPHKDRLDPDDRAVLADLGVLAAAPLHCAQLRARVASLLGDPS